jgi:hypothetical protein
VFVEFTATVAIKLIEAATKATCRFPPMFHYENFFGSFFVPESVECFRTLVKIRDGAQVLTFATRVSFGQSNEERISRRAHVVVLAQDMLPQPLDGRGVRV